MAQIPFAHAHTEYKLKSVFDYANFYTKALRAKPNPIRPYRLHYLDAFAGTGEIPALGADMPLLPGLEDASAIMEGSARRALSVQIPFARYVLADAKKKNTIELEKLVQNFPALESRIEIAQGDANVVVRNFCGRLGANDRVLVFLDPFGNQVRWDTLEILAQTQKVDLWYLFPAWLGVARQVKSNGIITSEAESSIDQMFGPHDWRKEAVSEQLSAQHDMFAGEVSDRQKIATADGITRYMIRCMGTIFGRGVSQRWIPLGRNGRHYYSLLFACANPRDSAIRLSLKVVNHIMTRK